MINNKSSQSRWNSSEQTPGYFYIWGPMKGRTNDQQTNKKILSDA